MSHPLVLARNNQESEHKYAVSIYSFVYVKTERIHVLRAWTLEACALTTDLFRDLDGGEKLRVRRFRKFHLADDDWGVVTIVVCEVASRTSSHNAFSQPRFENLV